MRYLITFIFTILSILLVQAQYVFPSYEKSILAKNKKLAVQLREEISEKEKKQNDYMKQIFSTYLSNWEKIEFCGKERINQLKKANDNEYILLTQDSMIFTYGRKVNYLNANGMNSTAIQEYIYYYYTFDISNGEDLITSVELNSGNLHPSDYLFICQQFNRLIKSAQEKMPLNDYYNVNKNIDIIKIKTLLLPEDLFKSKYHKKITSYYKYPCKFVKKEEFEKIVLSRDSTAIYPKIIATSSRSSYQWLFVNAKDGAILSLMSYGGFQGSKNKPKLFIKPSHLKYNYAKFAQKLNNFYK